MVHSKLYIIFMLLDLIRLNFNQMKLDLELESDIKDHSVMVEDY